MKKRKLQPPKLWAILRGFLGQVFDADLEHMSRSLIKAYAQNHIFKDTITLIFIILRIKSFNTSLLHCQHNCDWRGKFHCFHQVQVYYC